MNLQVTILKLLVSYPNGLAKLDDLKRDIAILATSGQDWSERTKRLAARVPDLSIFSMRLVERYSFGWRITQKGRGVLEYMESHERPSVVDTNTPEPECALGKIPPMRGKASRRARGRSRQRRSPRAHIA